MMKKDIELVVYQNSLENILMNRLRKKKDKRTQINILETASLTGLR